MEPVGGIVIDRVIPEVAGGIVLWPGKAPGPPRAPEGSLDNAGIARAPVIGGVFEERLDG